MAKYTVTHSCGHSQEHQLFGKHKGFGGRDSKLEWLKTQLCTGCWKAQKEAAEREAREKENERSAALAKVQNLPALTGSEKQIVWATSIRQQMIDDLESFINESGKAEFAAQFAVLREAFRAVILSHTESRWFIDNREFGTVRVAFGQQLVDWVKANKPEVLAPVAQ